MKNFLASLREMVSCISAKVMVGQHIIRKEAVKNLFASSSTEGGLQAYGSKDVF